MIIQLIAFPFQTEQQVKGILCPMYTTCNSHMKLRPSHFKTQGAMKIKDEYSITC